MKPRGWIVLSFAILSGIANPCHIKAASVVPARVTLEEAYQSALARTETVPLGRARISQSEARVGQLQSRFLPALSFGANYEQRDTATSSGFLTNGQSSTRLSLSQSLYEGGRDKALLRASGAEKRSQEHLLSAAKHDTFTTVARAFYAILSGEQEVENLRRTIELANARIKEIRARTKIGRSRNIEFLAAQAQLSVLDAQLSAAQGDLVVARDQFALITGLGGGVGLIQEKQRLQAPNAIETYIAQIDRRPDIQAIMAQVEASKSGIRAAQAGHLPSIGLFGNYYLSRDTAQQANDWDAGAALTLPLFSGGAVKSQVQEARGRETELELLLDQTRRQAQIEIRTAYNGVVSAINQLRSLESALSTTEQNYKEQEKNYRFGQATNLDVIQALNSFQDTKRTLDRTRYEALAAWAELKAATASVQGAQ